MCRSGTFCTLEYKKSKKNRSRWKTWEWAAEKVVDMHETHALGHRSWQRKLQNEPLYTIRTKYSLDPVFYTREREQNEHRSLAENCNGHVVNTGWVSVTIMYGLRVKHFCWLKQSRPTLMPASSVCNDWSTETKEASVVCKLRVCHRAICWLQRRPSGVYELYV